MRPLLHFTLTNDLLNLGVVYFVFCIGLGQSKAAVAPAAVGELAPGTFLQQVCESLQLGPVVVVSPSLSGMYSLPFLFQHTSMLKAYVPIAPICTDKFNAQQYASVQVCECMLRHLSLHCISTGGEAVW